MIAQNNDPCEGIDLLLVNDTSICEDTSIIITAINGYDNYSWDNGPNSQSITITTAGTYTVSTFFTTNNLVANGNFNAGNSGFSSEYIYNPTSLWNEGTYAITTNANNVHPNFVGTGAGNFLVVNGSTSPGTEVWCQNVTVEPNTNYNFSSIVSTVAGGNSAVLQFSINGNTIGTPFNAPNNTGNWQEFNATWASTTTATAEICVVNQNTGGSGNDFALDNINFTTLCEASESITVSFSEEADATIGTVDELCETDAPLFLETIDGGGDWSGNGINNNGLFNPQIAGPGEHIIIYEISGDCGDTHQITISVLAEASSNITALEAICENGIPISLGALPTPGTWSGNGITDTDLGVFAPSEALIGWNTITYEPSMFCVATSQHQIFVHEVFIPDVETGFVICYGDEVELNTGGNFVIYQWSSGENTPSITTGEVGDYHVELIDANECESALTFVVAKQVNCEYLIMPTVFTPNGDNQNDSFSPVIIKHIPAAQIRIFNRWGLLLYESSNIYEGWNGYYEEKLCSSGTYYWQIDFQDIRGIEQAKSGFMELIH